MVRARPSGASFGSPGRGATPRRTTAWPARETSGLHGQRAGGAVGEDRHGPRHSRRRFDGVQRCAGHLRGSCRPGAAQAHDDGAGHREQDHGGGCDRPPPRSPGPDAGPGGAGRRGVDGERGQRGQGLVLEETGQRSSVVRRIVLVADMSAFSGPHRVFGQEPGDPPRGAQGGVRHGEVDEFPRAACAVREVLSGRTGVLPSEFAREQAHEIRCLVPRFAVFCHAGVPPRTSMSVSLCMPRAIRALTVPRGTPRRCAISSCVRSEK